MVNRFLKMLYAYTKNFYLTMKRNEWLIFAARWMIPRLLLYEGFYVKRSRKSKTIETERRSEISWVREWTRMLTANGHLEILCSDGSVLRLDCGNGHSIV